MKFLSYFIWLITGAGLSIIILLTQHWSVQKINLDNPRNSTWLIIGGAILRWLSISLVFLAALSYSVTTMLIVFTSFMIVRLIILFAWQGLLFRKRIKI